MPTSGTPLTRPTAGPVLLIVPGSRASADIRKSLYVASSALPRLRPLDHCSDRLRVEGLAALLPIASNGDFWTRQRPNRLWPAWWG